MKKLTVISLQWTVAVLLLLNLFAFADEGKPLSPKYTFYKANTLYEENRYDDAIKEYEGLINQGFESGNLYYNIGNCYFKKGEHGKAILNYERAKLLIPNDSDLKFNLGYVRSLLKEETEAVDRLWIVRLLDKLSQLVTTDWLTVFLSALYIAICLNLVIYILFRTIKRFHMSIIMVMVVLFLLDANSLNSKIARLGKDAIIVAKEVESKFEPMYNATTYFVLSEGNKVEVMESKNDWRKIKRSDGKVGWVNKSTLELISEIRRRG